MSERIRPARTLTENGVALTPFEKEVAGFQKEKSSAKALLFFFLLCDIVFSRQVMFDNVCKSLTSGVKPYRKGKIEVERQVTALHLLRHCEQNLKGWRGNLSGYVLMRSK